MGRRVPLLMVVFLASLLSAGLTPAGAEDGGVPTGSISGVVTSLFEGGPIDGATVKAFGESGTLVASAQTSPDGSYTLSDLPDDEYGIVISAAGHAQKLHDGDSPSNGFVRMVTVFNGQETSGLLDELQPGAVVTGRVTELDGTPIANAEVRVASDQGSNWFPWGSSEAGDLMTDFGRQQWITTTTDANGDYMLAGLPAGGHKIEFAAPGRITKVWGEHESGSIGFSINTGQTRRGINALLRPAATITGTVIDSLDDPISGVEVRASIAGEPSRAAAITDINGNYVIDNAPVGSVEVEFDGGHLGYGRVPYSQTVATAAGESHTVDAYLALLGSISGRLVDASGTPVVGQSVNLSGSTQISGIPAAWATTDDSGVFTLFNISPGTGYVMRLGPWTSDRSLIIDTWYQAPSDSEISTFDIDDGSAIELGDIEVDRGATISGTVSLPDGTPITGGSVSAGTLDANGSFTSVRSISIRPDGTYSIAGLLGGTYDVRADDGFREPTTVEDIPVAPNGMALDIDFVLDASYGVSGTVTDDDGNGVAGASVSLTFAPLPGWVWKATTDESGDYVVRATMPGSWAASVALPDGSYQQAWSGPEGETEFEQDGTPHPNIDFVLPDLGSISGVVTGADDEPLYGIEVWAISDAGPSSTRSGADGSYSIELLPDGDYAVSFIDPAKIYAAAPYRTEPDGNDTIVSITNASDVSGVSMALAYGHDIEGTVLDSNGDPVAGEQVFIEDRSTDPVDIVGEAYTDTEGHYVVYGVPTGSYRAHAPAWGGVGSFHGATEDFPEGQDILVAGDVTGIDIPGTFTPPPTSLVSGTITDGAEEGVVGMSIAATDLEGNIIVSTSTGLGGGYQLALDPGTYRLVANVDDDTAGFEPTWFPNAATPESSTSITVADGIARPDTDLVMLSSGPTTGSINGTVVGADGDPAIGVTVHLYAGLDDTNPSETNANLSGEFSFAELDPGTYYVQYGAESETFIPEWFDDIAFDGTPTPIEVTAGQATTDIDATLDAPPTTGSISGVVTEPGGDPVSFTSVSLYRQAPGLPLVFVTTAMTTIEGAYTFEELDPATYVLRFGTSGAWVPQWYDDVAEGGEPTGVVVTAGATADGIDAELDSYLTISGTVTDWQGNPLESGTVRLYDASSGESVSGLVGLDQGVYSIPVQSGSYRIRYSGGYVHPAKWWGGSSTFAGAQTIVVTESISDLDLQLDESGSIEGTVTGPDGSPIEGVYVKVFDEDRHFVGAGFSAANGDYSVEAIGTGSHQVLFNPPFGNDALLAEMYDNKEAVIGSGTPVATVAGQTTTGIDAQLETPFDLASDEVSTLEDTAVLIDVLDNDAAAVVSTLSVIGQPSKGSAAITNGAIRYTPDSNVSGADTITYRACSALGECATTTVAVTVSPVNDRPVATADRHTAVEDGRLSVPAPGVLGNDADADSEALTTDLVSGAGKGTVSLGANGSFQYTPTPGTCGTDSFRYRAGDGSLWSPTVTVTIDITCAPEPTEPFDGTISQAEELDDVLAARDYSDDDADTLRLYRAFFDRDPDIVGLKYWLSVSRNGTDYDTMAWGFANSDEFVNTYGGVSDRRFLEIVYTNVLGRTPDSGGFEYWYGEIVNGLDRHLVVRWVAAGDEFEVRFPYQPAG